MTKLAHSENTKLNDSSKAKLKKIFAGITFVIIVSIIFVISEIRKTVTVAIDGETKKYVTYKGSLKELLDDNNIKIKSEDKLNVDLDSKLSKNQMITIKRAIPIKILTANGEFELSSSDDTIEEMLSNNENVLTENGIVVDKNIDEISPSIDTKLESGLNVKIVKVENKKITEEEKIAFDTVVEKTSEYDINYENIKNEGVEGVKQVTYQVVYKDGVENSREISSTQVLSQPINKTIVKGTAAVSTPNRGNENSSDKGQKVLQCSATAYSGGWGTSSGRKPCRIEGGISTIAVDPTVIPMGSKVYVEGYGYAVAADTGTSIKGNKIDVYFNSYKESCDWGLKQVKVTIIAYPGEW